LELGMSASTTATRAEESHLTYFCQYGYTTFGF
jgi:hypothetical protein